MATTKNMRYPAREGPPSLRSRKMHFEDYQGDGHRLPANIFSALFDKNMAPIIGGGHSSAVWSITITPGFTPTVGGTGDVIADAVAGGIRITTPSDDDFNVNLESILAVTPTTGKWYGMVARIVASDATGIGFKLGLGNSQALPFTTNYTDCVVISKAIASASVLGQCRGNSGTAADSASLGTLSTTEVEVGFAVYVHATEAQGYWSYKTAAADEPTFTAFTSDQNAQVALLLTTPTTCYWNINATGVTATTPTLDLVSFIAGGDR